MFDNAKLFGFSFLNCTPLTIYTTACLGILISFILPTLALQTLHFEYQPFFATFLQFFVTTLTCLPSLFARFSSHKPPELPARFFLFLSPILTFSTVLHHFAAARLSRSTELLFKSPKLIPVIVGNFVFLKRHLSASEIIIACLFVAGFVGIAIDGFGDRGDYDIVGIVSVFLSLLLESVAVNFEEYLLLDCRLPQSEVMGVIFAIGTAVTFVGCIVSGEFLIVAQKIEAAPSVAVYWMVYAGMGALGLHFVFFSVVAFGSMQTVLFTSARKMFVCIVSGLVDGEITFGWWYKSSVCLSVMALTANAWSKVFETDGKVSSDIGLDELLDEE